jgi:hypothetical protein
MIDGNLNQGDKVEEMEENSFGSMRGGRVVA